MMVSVTHHRHQILLSFNHFTVDTILKKPPVSLALFNYYKN